jgi:putative membrane protein
VDNPLTADERRQIDAAITAVEQSTRADLDVMVTRASDRYSLYPVAWAGFCALMVAGIAAVLRPGLNGRSVIILQLLMLIVMTALCDWMPIRLWLVPMHVKHSHARQLAHREFRAHFAGNKPTRECILFFVSLGEHYVEIIADHETHSRVQSKIWNKMISDFTAAVADGRVAEGLLGAIESCGAILKTHYPRCD